MTERRTEPCLVQGHVYFFWDGKSFQEGRNPVRRGSSEMALPGRFLHNPNKWRSEMPSRPQKTEKTDGQSIFFRDIVTVCLWFSPCCRWPSCCGPVGFFGLCIYSSRLLIAFCSFQLFLLERQIISKPVPGSVSLCNWHCVLGPSLGGSREAVPGGMPEKRVLFAFIMSHLPCYLGHR